MSVCTTQVSYILESSKECCDIAETEIALPLDGRMCESMLLLLHTLTTDHLRLRTSNQIHLPLVGWGEIKGARNDAAPRIKMN